MKPKFKQRIGKPAVRRRVTNKKLAPSLVQMKPQRSTAAPRALGKMGGQLEDETQRNTGARPSARAIQRANPNASFKRATAPSGGKLGKVKALKAPPKMAPAKLGRGGIKALPVGSPKPVMGGTTFRIGGITSEPVGTATRVPRMPRSR